MLNRGVRFFLAVLFAATVSDAASAICVFKPTSASSFTGAGHMTLLEDADGIVTVAGYVSGLVANSTHGIHIHMLGDMNSTDGLATKGHYNPMNVSHSCTNAERHAGDMGNLMADDSGNATFSYTDAGKLFSLTGNRSVIGRAIILHAKADDCVSQPTGNASSRLAQCVIGWQAEPAQLNVPAYVIPPAGANCVLQATEFGAAANYNAVGIVTFTHSLAGIVTVNAHFTGLAANSSHGLHVHQFGNLNSWNASSAGSHYNPFNANHSCSGINRHVGDMGNLVADANGEATFVFEDTDKLLSLISSTSIIGRAVVLHAGTDNCVSVSSAGGRLAHCVIGWTVQPSINTTTNPENNSTGNSTGNNTGGGGGGNSAAGLSASLLSVVFAMATAALVRVL